MTSTTFRKCVTLGLAGLFMAGACDKRETTVAAPAASELERKHEGTATGGAVPQFGAHAKPSPTAKPPTTPEPGPTAGYLMPMKPPAEKSLDGKPMAALADPRSNTEDYQHYAVNRMTATADDHLSTFAVDVDTASYSIARKKILAGEPVPADSVRVEEWLNYFKYTDEGPGDDRPFAVHMEAAPSPFTHGRYLLRIGVKGRDVAKSARKPAHLVFLVDVSGSMDEPDKLPLVRQSLRILTNNLNDGDTVAIVTYAGATRLVLPPTTMSHKADIYAAIDQLEAGGSTAMASGIELAYHEAAKTLSPDSVSRVLVLTDGDANVGKTSHEAILATISGYVKEGVTLSTIGFGMGNYKDTMMEQLADKGNGNYFYIDGLSQAKRVFQEQLGGTLEVIAQDVKIQVDFDPKAVSFYRLVGYENRDIRDEDFRNDKVDAGEIGAGHAVTAMYEVELVKNGSPTLASVHVRAKKPRGQEAAEWAYPFARTSLRTTFDGASADFRFATAVMGAAEILRHSPYADGWRMDQVVEIARNAATAGNEERSEFVTLVSRPAAQSTPQHAAK